MSVCVCSSVTFLFLQTLSSRNLSHGIQCPPSMSPMPASQLVFLLNQLVPQWTGSYFQLGSNYVPTWHFLPPFTIVQLRLPDKILTALPLWQNLKKKKCDQTWGGWETVRRWSGVRRRFPAVSTWGIIVKTTNTHCQAHIYKYRDDDKTQGHLVSPSPDDLLSRTWGFE